MRDLTGAVRIWLGPCLFALAISGCVAPSDSMSLMEAPPMGWDHRPEAREWTSSTLLAVSQKDDVLADQVPADIAEWCPGYPNASLTERRAFWAGLLSAVAKYESTWNPKAAGGGGRWIGLMQISPVSARNYGCEVTSVAKLKDGSANLECAVELLAYQVERDRLVAGNGNRGVGRDWAPLRDAGKREAMARWTRAQPYCSKN